MTILVIGGNGFIGSHLVDALLARGRAVRVLDIEPERYRPPLSGVDYMTGGYQSKVTLVDALEGVDIVVHLVSTTLPSTSNEAPEEDVLANLIPLISLIRAMLKSGKKRIVYLSSGGTVYGDPQTVPIGEDHPLHPKCSYGIVKVAAENYLRMYAEAAGLDATILRPSNPFGPRQGNMGIQGVIAAFLKKAIAAETLDVWGDGEIVRDFLYIEDLAELCACAIDQDRPGTYNVGFGSGYSINEVIAAIGRVTNSQPDVQYHPGRDFDVAEVVLDSSRAAAAFDWRATTSLEEGIRFHWEWLKDSSP